ncbi:T9SS type A sorting domain-containing protein [Hymenobacter elongatus]|uniref:T9SS type A sorting domain-containing protein n=1 Tax=Hymenobacter elongatus TaxID=877208 RepID=A0A4Z0PM15_9BACT|nr:T9SS type A sorting domain-containing protein [Hymenobacter elongatus]TGE17213.1 T9SS type A sorting domain-containing protein [Hymenobacter elongatus]
MQHVTLKCFALLACWFSCLTLPAQAQTNIQTPKPLHSLETVGIPQPEMLVPMGRRATTVAQLQQRLWQRYMASTNSWQNEYRNLYSRYGASTLYGCLRSELWVDAAWKGFSETLRRYNASAQPVSDTLLILDRPMAEQRVWAYAYTYTNGQRTQVNWFLNQGNPTWLLQERTTLSYNAAGQLTHFLTASLSSSGVFEPYEQVFYIYNSQGQLEVFDYQRLDATGAWQSGNKIFYTYNSQGNVQQTRSQQIASSTGLLQDFHRDTYQYDAVGHLATKLIEEWNGIAWRTWAQNLYTYDAQGNLLSEHGQNWTGTSFQDGYRDLYTYTQITSVRAAATTRVSLAVSPNPVQGQAVLHYELPASATAATVDILDATGHQVATTILSAMGATQVSLPTEALPGGLYLVRLRAGACTGQTRLVVQ